MATDLAAVMTEAKMAAVLDAAMATATLAAVVAGTEAANGEVVAANGEVVTEGEAGSGLEGGWESSTK